MTLTKKNTKFNFNNNCREAFNALKHAFTTTLILQHFNSNLLIIVKVDASDYVTVGVLS